MSCQKKARPWLLAAAFFYVAGAALAARSDQDAGALQVRKAELEVRKLEHEVAAAEREAAGKWKPLSSTLLGVLSGIAGTLTTIWGARRSRLGNIDQAVHEKRLELYLKLVGAMSNLALYFPPHTSPGSAHLEPRHCAEIGRTLSAWYFSGGGLLLSTVSRDAYFRFARGLTRAAAADALLVPTFPDDAPRISREWVDRLVRELPEHLVIDDVEAWPFGSAYAAEPSQAATLPLCLRFKDYLFLQRLASTLRTTLAEDLHSRRRPS